MMRKMMMALALAGMCLVATGAAFGVTTGTCTVDLYGIDNMIAPPLVPFDPSPVHAGSSGIEGCMAGWIELYDGTGDALFNLDPTSGNLLTFGADWSDAALLVGKGYKAYTEGYFPNPTDSPVRSISFDGVNIADTDLWISLPGMDSQYGVQPPWEDWVGVNYPDDKRVSWFDVIVTDGVDAYKMVDIATGNGPSDWIDYNFYWIEPSTQNLIRIPDDGTTTDLQGGTGYQVFTYKNNLALILPAPGI